MATYTTDDAMRELGSILGKAPEGGVSGGWEATTMLAGHSSRAGGYRDAKAIRGGRPSG